MMKDPSHPNQGAPEHFEDSGISIRQTAPPAQTGRSSISAHGNKRRAARKSRTEMPEFADGRMRCGRLKVDPKVRQIVTGAAQQKTSTAKTQPSSAKALRGRNRASDQRETLISSVIRASGAASGPERAGQRQPQSPMH